jgi:hypothetical protein
VWYWYIAREDELLLDLDRPERKLLDGSTFLDTFFWGRLSGAIHDRKLTLAGKPTDSTVLVKSATPNHMHIYIRLDGKLPLFERMAWQLWLGSDLYRGRADLMRAARGHPHPSLLIEPQIITALWRKPDDQCLCARKHRTEDRPRCRTWRKYRGPSPWELFGRPWQAGARPE